VKNSKKDSEQMNTSEEIGVHITSLPGTSQLSEFCPRYHHAMDIIGRRWMGAILRVLIHGTHRYNEILLAIPGISDRLLTERLRDLEAEGLAVRHVSTTAPIRVQYELTERGQELELAVRVISAWAEKWIPAQEIKK
jgi:DNA-binding HxlR family transcriptional regulator